MPLSEPGASAYGTFNEMRRDTEDEGDHLLTDGYMSDDGSSAGTSVDSVQEGVRKIEAINLTWTTRSLIIAYIRCVILPTLQMMFFKFGVRLV